MTPEALLEEASWLKRLALTLAGDSDDADDLVQESWIAAWRRNPDTSRPLRPWLGKVVRDRSRMRRRAEGRRAQREASVPESDESATPDELLDQVRLHRLLVDLVLELDEPYRSTVLARFVEGETSASIAKRLGVPESTVRWRLREALARLRKRLDEHNGDRRAWAPAVLAFAQKGVAVAKSTKAALAIVALLVLLLGGLVVRFLVHRDDAISASGSPTSQGASARVGTGDQRWNNDALLQLRTDKQPAGWFAQQGAISRRISGIVMSDGLPARGALVRLEDESSRVGLSAPRERRTSDDGHFDFGLQQPSRFDVGAYLPGRVATVKHVDLRNPRTDSEHVVVVVEPCVVGLYGRIVDASGGPIAHAQLLAQGVIGTETDAAGSFDICLDAQGNSPDDRRLVIRASGYGTVELIAPLAGRVRHDFMLSPEATVTGRVVNSSGEAVVMADVRLAWDEAVPRPGSEQPGAVSCVTDGNGRFECAGVAAGRLRVRAFARGAAAAPTTITVGPGEVKEVQLMVKQGGVLRGRVVSDGKPVGGVAVYDRGELPTYQTRAQITSAINEAVSQEDGTFVLDHLPLGTISIGASPYRLRGPTTVQITSGEQSVELEVEPLGALTGTVRRNGRPVAHALVRASGTNWANKRSAETDETGRYLLEGLEADDYALFAHSATVGAYAEMDKTVRVEVGARIETDLDLRFGARISGRVVDAKGIAVTGAFVTFHNTENEDMSRCTTDATGTFSCASMSGSGSYRVVVAATEASPTPYPFVGSAPSPILLRDGDAHVEDLRLEVDPRTLTIKGLVVDPSNQPVADARVFANPNTSVWASVPTSVTNLRGEFELRDLSPGSYRVEALGIDGAKTSRDGVPGGTTDVRLLLETPSCNGSIDPKVGALLREVPATVGNRPEVRTVWDESIELIGWDGPRRVHAGEPFQLSLVFKVLKPLDRSWKFFIHADGSRKRVNVDHEPLGGRCPTSTWKAGDIIVDRTQVRVDPAFDRGAYQVWIGFFSGWEPSWKNLPLSDAPAALRDEHERYKLTSIVVDN